MLKKEVEQAMPTIPRHLRSTYQFSVNGTRAPIENGDSKLPHDLPSAIEMFKVYCHRNGAKKQTRDHYAKILVHDLPGDPWPLTPWVLEQWRDRQLKLAEGSQYSRWTIMRQFISWLMRKGVLTEDPILVADLRRPDKPKPQPYKRTADPEEIAALLRVLDRRIWWEHRLTVLIILLRNTGLRVSEALNLRWCDIHWDSPVSKEAEIVLGEVEPQKNEDADNIAHMIEPAYTELRNWQKRLRLAGQGEDEQWVFPTTTGRGFGNHGEPTGFKSTHWHYDHVWQMFYLTSLRAGLNSISKKRWIHPHMLRHTAGTEFAVATDDLESTRIFLRHADYTQTRAYLDPKKTRARMMAQHRKVTGS